MNQIVQGSPEWFQQRIGKVTASRITDVLATLKSGGEAATRANYRSQLVCERLTGNVAESFTNDAMKWGTEQEPNARQAYEFISGNTVVEVPMIDHPIIAMTGASPDGLIGDDGLIEIKCPNSATHIDYLLAGVVPAKHMNQMLWQMECTGRKWCDFVSYDPRLPIDLQLFIVRFERDDEALKKIRDGVVAFLNEVSETVSKLNNLKGNK